MDAKIFISYRRKDSDASAGRLYDSIVAKFDKNNVFKDVDNIPLGADFKEIIDRKIDESNVVLVVIGKKFTRINDENGVSRIFGNDDFVNMEISTAISKGKIIIPVLVDGASIPRKGEIPDNINKLHLFNGIALDHDRWHRDTEKLFSGILEAIEQLKIAKAAGTKPLIDNNKITNGIVSESKSVKSSPIKTSVELTQIPKSINRSVRLLYFSIGIGLIYVLMYLLK